MSLVRSSVLAAAVATLCGACDSKIESTTLDPVLQKKVNAIANCFPQLFAKGQDLLDLADTWWDRSNGNPPDPSGLVHTGTGPIDVTYTVDGCTITMQIKFYDPTGVEQTNIGTGTALSDKIDTAATSLRASFPGGTPFIVGDWSLSGTKDGDPVTGSGALTGLIGGSTNGNELEELRTTTATPAGGPPPNADSTVIETHCSMTFNTTGLLTDERPGQEFPEGVVDIAIDDDDTTEDPDVTATLTFDGSSVITIAIDGVDRFTYDATTRTLTSIAP